MHLTFIYLFILQKQKGFLPMKMKKRSNYSRFHPHIFKHFQNLLNPLQGQMVAGAYPSYFR